MTLNEIDRVERLLKQLLLHSGPMSLDSSRFNIHELLNTVIQFEKILYLESSLRESMIHLFQKSILIVINLPDIFKSSEKRGGSINKKFNCNCLYKILREMGTYRD